MRFVQICKRCGRVFPREDAECPKCHFNKKAHDDEVLAAQHKVKRRAPAQKPPEYKICARCGMPIEIKHDKCPLCGSFSFRNKPAENQLHAPTWNYNSEGTGRGWHGAACDICPHCHGTPGWCPLLD